MESQNAYLLTLILLLITSCSAKKNMKVRNEFNIRDSMVYSRKDSLRKEYLSELVNHKQIEWKEIILSSPDTTGRQYIERVLTAKLISDRKEEVTTRVAERYDTTVDRHTTIFRNEEEVTTVHPKKYVWFILIIVVTIAAVYLFYKR